MDRPTSETLPALLREVAAAAPDRTAVIDGEERRRTFAALREASTAVARALADRGIGDGDRVGILMENRVEWVEAMFGVLRAGATVVGVNTWARRRELEYLLSHADPALVVATGEFLGNDYATMIGELLGHERAADGASGGGGGQPAGAPEVVLLEADRPWADRYRDLFDADAALPAEPNRPDDTALLLYTSGSTARPKGVPLLHGDAIENSYHIGERQQLDGDDRVWLASPLFWSYGSANALCAALTHHAGLVVQAPFEPERAVELIVEHGCTVYYGMPNMARELVTAEGFDRSAVPFETGTTIGTPEDLRFTVEELGVSEVCNIYGSTETYGNCAVTDRSEPEAVRFRTQGRPLPGQEVVVKDPETGERLAAGETGELCVRGRVTPGYFDDPEQNEAAFDAEGFLHMGDLGMLDEDGRVRYQGRLKELIKTGGINVSPLEVETFLETHPAIEQAHVVGLDDPEKDEVVGAVVVPATGATVTAADLRAHCEELAGYKRPRQFAFADAADVPETDTGKVKKQELARLFD